MTVSLLLAVVLVVAILVAIFVLARQDVHTTGDVALFFERRLLSLVRPTGTGDEGEPTWLGLTIRKLAHVAEYAALGCCVAAVVVLAGLDRWYYPIVACGVVSVFDECHKLIVPGRHFDGWDLMLDALGYVPSSLLVMGVACAVSVCL